MSEVVNMGTKATVEGIDKFVKLIQDFNVIGFALGIMIGNNVAELANTFIDGIIMPTLEPLLKKAGGKEMTVRVGGLTFHLEKIRSSYNEIHWYIYCYLCSFTIWY